MEAPDNFEQGKTPNLEVETLKIKQFRLKKRRIIRLLTGTETGVQFPTTILITEHNVLKRRDKEIFGDTFDRLRIALDSGKISDIPPIVVFQNPFVSIEDTVEAYQNYGYEPQNLYHHIV